MTTKQRRQKEKEDRKNAILKAAEVLFLDKGVENTTMDEIAELSELGKGTLYLYFKSKQEIFSAVSLKAFKIMYKLFQEGVKSSTTGLEKIKTIGMKYYEFYNSFPGLFKLLSQYDSSNSGVEDTYAQEINILNENIFENFLIGSIKVGINDKSIRKDINPTIVSLLLAISSAGLFQIITKQEKYIKNQFNIDSKKLVLEIFELYIKGLEPREK
ncbi:MAG: TetR/AcrR family transcriptional regulator [Candidatus Hodarchaeales archaeon]|jgi:AcrR family transcriptional regulator